MAETTGVGKVSEEAVRLQRVIPMVGNSFKPFFFGRFEARGNVTVLVGKFTMLPAVKIFMSFWFGMCGVFAGAALLGKFRPQAPHATLFLLQPFLMIGAGIAVVGAGKWFARNDVVWLSELIKSAMSVPSASENRGGLVNAETDSIPMALKIASIFLAASGATALVAGAAGTHLWPSLGTGALSTESKQLGNWYFVYAILLIVLSMGVWGRRRWAWWCGFLLLGFSVCWSIFVMRTGTGFGVPIALNAFFTIFPCVVVGVWGLWWYAQRKYFL
jgi:hypothetical protein